MKTTHETQINPQHTTNLLSSNGLPTRNFLLGNRRSAVDKQLAELVTAIADIDTSKLNSQTLQTVATLTQALTSVITQAENDSRPNVSEQRTPFDYREFRALIKRPGQ